MCTQLIFDDFFWINKPINPNIYRLSLAISFQYIRHLWSDM